MTFAHYEGEDPEQTAAFVASLEVALEGAKQRGETDAAKHMEEELKRIRGDKAKQTRLRGGDAETRTKGAGEEGRLTITADNVTISAADKTPTKPAKGD